MILANIICRVACVIALLLLHVEVLAAGSVSGRVSSGHGHHFFEGAVVTLSKTGRQTHTGPDGRFSFHDVEPGRYEIAVDYIGAQPWTAVIDVSEQNTREVEVRLNAIEEIVVVGQMAGASAALNKQRSADNTVSVVSADSIGQLLDANASEALQRVAGAFVVRDMGEGRFVGIRGINPGLNSTRINGQTIPAPERETRAVALDVVPAEVLEGLEVTKTFTPDMDADGVGGSVNVQSLSAFDRKDRFFSFSGSGSYNEDLAEVSPKLSATFTDTFGVGEREDALGVALAVTWEEREFGVGGLHTDGGWNNELTTTNNVDFFGAEELEHRDYEITRERLATVFNVDYRVSDLTTVFLHSMWTDYADNEIRHKNEYKLDKGDALEGRAGFALWEDAELQRELKQRYEEQQVFATTLGINHEAADWSVVAAASFASSEEDEPNRRDVTFEADIAQMGYESLGTTPTLFVSNDALDASIFELDELVVENNRVENREIAFHFDVTRYTELVWARELQAGMKWRERTKSSDLGIDVYDGFVGDPTLADFQSASPGYDISRNFGPGISQSLLNRYMRTNLAGFDYDAEESMLQSLGGDYDTDEAVTSAYVLARAEWDDWRVVYGVRVERTAFETRGFNLTADEISGSGDFVATAVKEDQRYTDVFPSINARHQIADDLFLRMAWSATVARPNFLESSASAIVEFADDDGETELEAELGNPDLAPLKSSNFDVGLHYFPGRLGFVGLELFYKDIQDFIFTTDVSATYPLSQLVGPVVVDDAEVLQPINGGDAHIAGIELAWVKHFDELPEPFDRLLLNFNATFSSSDADIGDRSVDLPEMPKRVLNLTLGYEGDFWSMRIAATQRGEMLRFIEDIDDAQFDIYQDTHTQIDLMANIRFSEQLTLTLSANNVNDAPVYEFYASPRFNARYEQYGPTYAMTLRFHNG